MLPSELADEQELDRVGEVERIDPLIELGSTGLKRAAGYIDEEFLPHLKGRKAVQVFREMGDNDPITGATLFAIYQLMRGVDYAVVPAGTDRKAAQAGKFLETCMDDMSDTFDETLMEIFSCIQYGWQWSEIVYKRCLGPNQQDGKYRSKYNDGLFRWRRIAPRSQETLQRWVFDENNNVRAMVQQGPPDYIQRVLPIQRSLLFRFGHAKNNPEGRSALRTSYRPWYYKKRLEEFESVGVERDLAGLPIVKVPAEYLRARKGTEQANMVESMRKMVRSVRRNEQEGIVFPTAFDQDTKQPLFNFELLSSGGARQHDTNALIQRYEQRQLMTMLADFIMVGHQSTGTYNLHVDKTGIFREALNATTRSICDVFNRYAIPRLFNQNGVYLEDYPKIQPSDVDAPDLAQLGAFLTQTAGLGFAWGPDVEMEKYLRHAAGLPELPEQEEASHRRLARMDEAARLAEEQTRLMAARSQLAQALAVEQQLADGEHTPETMAAVQQGQQGAQAISAGQQQQQIAGATEQRAAQDHDLAQSEQLFTRLGGTPPKGGSSSKSSGKKAK